MEPVFDFFLLLFLLQSACVKHRSNRSRVAVLVFYSETMPFIASRLRELFVGVNQASQRVPGKALL